MAQALRLAEPSLPLQGAGADLMGEDGGVNESPAVDRVATPAWTVSAVARRLGIAPATLRSWSNRYGIGPAGHEPGRYRRFTDDDVAELDTVWRLTRQGMPIATAAAVARDQHRGAVVRATPDVGTGVPAASGGPGTRGADVAPDELDALLGAAGRLDVDTLLSTLGDSLAARGVSATWEQLCRPALARNAAAELDPDTDDLACIDAECALAWSIITSLRRLPTPPPAPRGAPRVLLACVAGEQHTLALDTLYAALGERYVPARMLGPSVPAPALLHAAEQTRPAAVFAWAQTTRTARRAVLSRLRPHTPTVVAAGPGWDSTSLPPGVRAATGLDAAVALARSAVNGCSVGRN